MPQVHAVVEEQPALTRRDRQRQATYDEIVTIGRRLLATGDDLSLRAVAGEMGMTPPALYRYVENHAALMALIGRGIFVEVTGQMAQARDRYPVQDPGAQVAAASAAFRMWALGNPAEFRLVFASAQREAQGCPLVPGVTIPEEGYESFGLFFAEILTRLWQRYRFHIPSDEEFSPEVLAALRDQGPKEEVLAALPVLSPGMIWVFERAWARLYGIVTLEVFGHLQNALIGVGALFIETLRDISRDLAMEPEWDRLEAVLRQEMAATGG